MAILQANRLHLFRVLKKSVGKYQAQGKNEKPNRALLLFKSRRHYQRGLGYDLPYYSTNYRANH
nr:MAG TPA: hypothetical protein [Caudoviricetes sp.]